MTAEATPAPPAPSPAPAPAPAPAPSPGVDELNSVTTRDWVTKIEGMPDKLLLDPTINLYETPVDALKGLLHHKKVASSKLAVPGKDATDEDWNKTFDALGRPAKAEDYDLGFDPLPDDAGDDVKAERTAMETRYKEAAHGLGLTPKQASALAKLDVARIEAAQGEFYAKGETELAALQTEMGADYAPKAEAAKALYRQLFPDDPDFADALDRKVGSAGLMKGFIKLAGMMGEHVRIDGGGGEFGTPAEAQKTLDAKQQDKGWREKYLAGDTGTVAEYNKLLAAAKGQAQARG